MSKVIKKSENISKPDRQGAYVINNETVKKSGKDFRKVWYYFHKLIRSKKFNKDIEDIRKKYNIIPFVNPTGGKFYPHKNEVQYNEIIDLCSKYGLHFAWADSIITIIAYGLTKDVIISKNFKETGFCTIAETTVSKNTKDAKSKNEDSVFPISIKISPYASKEVIRNFIDKNYNKIIKPLQDKYANPNIDPRDIREKDDTVQAMQDLIMYLKFEEEMEITSIKEIVNRRFNKVLTDNEISRMINRIKKYTQ